MNDTAWKEVTTDGYPQVTGDYICKFENPQESPEILEFDTEEDADQWVGYVSAKVIWRVTSWAEIPQ